MRMLTPVLQDENEKPQKLFGHIIFENDDFLAFNKYSGVLSIPDRMQSEKSLKDFLLEKYPSIFTVHRLDKDTSGLILFAKNEAAHKYFSQLFQERTIEKFYVGIVLGQPAKTDATIAAPIEEHPVHKGLMRTHRNGKEAITSYEVLEGHRLYSLLSFQLHTGRTHQIRVHCKEMGHPLACDPLYGDGEPILLSAIKKKFKLGRQEEERPMLQRLALHSHRLIFATENGTAMELIADIPKEFKAVMTQVKKNSR